VKLKAYTVVVVGLFCIVWEKYGKWLWTLEDNPSCLRAVALDEWRQPFLEARRRRQEEEKEAEKEAEKGARSLARARYVAKENERREPERIRAIALTANRQVKAVLKQLEERGELDRLELLVFAIFPHATLSSASRSTTYAGAGSKELRVCIAALAFGRPPALIWREAGVRQPGYDSELWQTVTSHPAFLALGRPIHQARIA
jgi:hypothetical protein